MAGTIDDNTTTGALDFFIALWRVTRDDTDWKTVLSVGEFLLKAQYADSRGWQSTGWFPTDAKAAYDRIARIGRAAYAKERADKNTVAPDQGRRI